MVRPHGIFDGGVEDVVSVVHGNVTVAVSGGGNSRSRHGRGRGGIGGVEDDGVAGRMMDHGQDRSGAVGDAVGDAVMLRMLRVLRVVIAVGPRRRRRRCCYCRARARGRS